MCFQDQSLRRTCQSVARIDNLRRPLDRDACQRLFGITAHQMAVMLFDHGNACARKLRHREDGQAGADQVRDDPLAQTLPVRFITLLGFNPCRAQHLFFIPRHEKMAMPPHPRVGEGWRLRG
jgi:hypothetical protein